MKSDYDVDDCFCAGTDCTDCRYEELSVQSRILSFLRLNSCQVDRIVLYGFKFCAVQPTVPPPLMLFLHSYNIINIINIISFISIALSPTILRSSHLLPHRLFARVRSPVHRPLVSSRDQASTPFPSNPHPAPVIARLQQYRHTPIPIPIPIHTHQIRPIHLITSTVLPCLLTFRSSLWLAAGWLAALTTLSTRFRSFLAD